MKELRAPTIYMASFESWAKKTKYKELYKAIPKKTLGVAKAAFSEMTSLTPMAWAMWWHKEHNRFIRLGIPQRELLMVHECLHQFLLVFCRGGLKSGKEVEERTEDQTSIDRL